MAGASAVGCLLLGLFLVLATAAGAAGAEATGLRFGVDDHRTRVVIDLDRPVHYTISAASAPDRLVVDFSGVTWRVPERPQARPRGLVRGHALMPGSAGARLAVTMAGPFRVVGNIILPPSADSARYRLVVDLVPSAPAASPRTAMATAIEAAEPSAVAVPEPTPRPGTDVPAGVAAPQARRPVIVIDPGHGGADPGAIAVDGAYEKTLVLEMARDLRRLIEENGRYEVALTREDDRFISLRDRIVRARELGGQIFISLHADSLRIAEQRGVSVYTLSETASDAEAARLANQENRADILAGTDLSQHDDMVATILLDLAQRDTNNRSITFADLLAEELATVTTMLRNHRRFAGFAVLKSPDIPSVLLELGYLSNPDDARNLAQPDYRARLSRAIVRALDRFFAVSRT